MPRTPNVVLIISDQWATQIADGSGDYDGVIQTPGIDRLAREGIRFTQSYSTFPLCCPARATLFTGRMPHNNHILDNEEIYNDRVGSTPTRTDIPTLGGVFKAAGYETAYFGKEHAAGYAWDGIDQFGSMKYSAGGMLSEGSAYDQIFTRDAIEFIRQDHTQPFYMTLSLINPHDICKVLGGKVKGATFADAIFFARTDDEPYLRFQQRPDLPSNHNTPYIKGMIRDQDYMYEELHAWSENDWKRYLAAYYLLLEKTDWYIELVLDALRDAGLEEDTIVVFTTDHGDMMGSHGLISKNVFYEESAKTMMLVKQPGQIAAGSVDEHTLVASHDLMPTLLDLCGIAVPAGLDGQSFKARCHGQPNGDFSHLYAEHTDGRMLRHGPYKYVHNNVYGEDHHILFDLENDPHETQNVYNQPGYEVASRDMTAKLAAWMQEHGLALTSKAFE
jgi:choline-sulfatase